MIESQARCISADGRFALDGYVSELPPPTLTTIDRNAFCAKTESARRAQDLVPTMQARRAMAGSGIPCSGSAEVHHPPHCYQCCQSPCGAAPASGAWRDPDATRHRWEAFRP